MVKMNCKKTALTFFLSVLLLAGLWAQQSWGSEFVHFSGISDASAGVLIGNEKVGYKLLIADDEDNDLRVYSPSGGLPEKVIEIKKEISGLKGKKEFDLEGAARIGDVVYWISSHGRDSKGNLQLSRHLFFATRVDDEELTATLWGKPFQELLEALISDPALKEFQLERAALLEPKKPNAFNIEGLAATAEGTLLIGFRNPVPKGKALLVPLKNPEEILSGSKPVFGQPITLSLGGLGIRDICYTGSDYLIVAGPPNKGICKLYHWDGKTENPSLKVLKIFPPDFAAEIIFCFPEKSNRKWFAVSDDGGKLVGGVENKKLPLSQRTFRGLWPDNVQ